MKQSPPISFSEEETPSGNTIENKEKVTTPSLDNEFAMRGSAMLHEPAFEPKTKEDNHISISDLPSPPAIDILLNKMVETKATDLYLTHGSAPAYRINGKITQIETKPLNDSSLNSIIENLLSEEQIDDFETTLELNTAKELENGTRLRINAYRQQQHNALVIRQVQTSIPTIEELNLPNLYSKIVMENRGLILAVGPTGSGKSTSIAAMIQHRNHNRTGHIITIEDPIEYIHKHEKCIISQRDIGIDTYSFGMALKNALRQQPDVIMIGEIRDRETMEHALNFSETGHLCLATLHANNANQAIERVLSFFPETSHKQILLNLSLNLRGVLSQRLIPNKKNSRSLATEILLNEGIIKNLIANGDVKKIKDIMMKSNERDMQTFDQSIFELYMKDEISEEIAIAYSDNSANIRLRITQQNHSFSNELSTELSNVASPIDPINKDGQF